MKTPAEIKKAMKCCMYMECRECPFRGGNCSVESAKDVLAYIEQLEASIDRVYALAKKMEDDLK